MIVPPDAMPYFERALDGDDVALLASEIETCGEWNTIIEEDMKLDFKDVLFRPKRSTLRSRSEVDLNRKYIFTAPLINCSRITSPVTTI